MLSLFFENGSARLVENPLYILSLALIMGTYLFMMKYSIQSLIESFKIYKNKKLILFERAKFVKLIRFGGYIFVLFICTIMTTAAISEQINKYMNYGESLLYVLRRQFTSIDAVYSIPIFTIYVCSISFTITNYIVVNRRKLNYEKTLTEEAKLRNDEINALIQEVEVEINALKICLQEGIEKYGKDLIVLPDELYFGIKNTIKFNFENLNSVFEAKSFSQLVKSAVFEDEERTHTKKFFYDNSVLYDDVGCLPKLSKEQFEQEHMLLSYLNYCNKNKVLVLGKDEGKQIDISQLNFDLYKIADSKIEDMLNSDVDRKIDLNVVKIDSIFHHKLIRYIVKSNLDFESQMTTKIKNIMNSLNKIKIESNRTYIYEKYNLKQFNLYIS